MAASNPVWLTVVLALGSALAGVGVRTVWEEHRDFLGARRIVSAELRANARAARISSPGLPTLGARLGDSSYRSVQLVLARRLPATLYADLELAYSQLTPEVKESLARPGFETTVKDTAEAMARLAEQLESYWPWTRFRLRLCGR